MGFFSKLFGFSATAEKAVVRNYLQTHRPSPNPLDDLLQMLKLWVDSAPPVSDQNKLRAFMDSFADDWHVSWKKGTADEACNWFRQCASSDLGSGGHTVYGLGEEYQVYGQIVLETTPGFWEQHGVVGSVIELGVSGAYHVIGKASDSEFFYLAHQ